MFASLRYNFAKKIILEVAPKLPIGALTLTFPEGDTHHFKGKKKG